MVYKEIYVNKYTDTANWNMTSFFIKREKQLSIEYLHMFIMKAKWELTEELWKKIIGIWC